MKLFLFKNKTCFREKKRPYYGDAGDSEIAAIIAADNEKDARNILLKDEYFSLTDLKEKEWFKKYWTVEELKVPKQKKIILLTYGMY